MGILSELWRGIVSGWTGKPARRRKKTRKGKRVAPAYGGSRKSAPAPVRGDLESALRNQGYKGAVLTAKVNKGLAASRTDFAAAFKGAMAQ